MPQRWTHVLASTALAAGMPSGIAVAAVQVVTGPTPIVDGEAVAAHDITVSNEKLAIALAVETPVPYGVPRGAIIDVAPVVDGKPGRDRVVFADFIPNNWSAWPNTYQHVDILERGPGRAVIRATRDWGKVTIETTYTLAADSDHVELRTKMTNTGAQAVTDLLSGQTLWPSSGYVFAVPGLAGVAMGDARQALSDRVVAYDEDWTITLHAPYLTYVSSSSKDMFLRHALQPRESRTFDAWLQVGTRGDLVPVVAAEIERKHLPSGTVHGVVTASDGKPVAQPVVVIEQQGKPYAWALGRNGQYEVQLPVGSYELYATAKGYSQAPRANVQVTQGMVIDQAFSALQPPGRIDFDVIDSRNRRPLDARAAITAGQRPLVEFLGRNTFFTELDRKGHGEMSLAPGHYEVAVSSGGGFFSSARTEKFEVKPGQTLQAKVAVTPLFEPSASGWYAADLHHHADQAEAVTPPEYLARSQLAAGLDLLFVSDHDSTVNHAHLQPIADRRDVPLIASMELSPSWGHFNAWPLQPGMKLAIDLSTATVDQVFAEARRQGAMVVQSNHPLIPYGYLASLAAGVVPGGFNPAFDLVEINSDEPEDDAEVLREVWKFWNAGHRYYLSSGTDTHDVWNHVSGNVRSFAHVEGPLTARGFAQSMLEGHSYVSYGPLIYPAVMFGSDLKVKPGATFTLAFELESVLGLKQAELIGNGAVAAHQAFADSPQKTRVEFKLTAGQARWYSIQVEDRDGHKAFSDPIWIDVVDSPAATQH